MSMPLRSSLLPSPFFFCGNFTRGMRLFKFFSLFGLLFGARASSLSSREPAPHPLDTRELLDVCASINAELNVPDLLGIVTAVGVIGSSTSLHMLGRPVPDFASQISVFVCRPFPFSSRQTLLLFWGVQLPETTLLPNY